MSVGQSTASNSNALLCTTSLPTWATHTVGGNVYVAANGASYTMFVLLRDTTSGYYGVYGNASTGRVQLYDSNAGFAVSDLGPYAIGDWLYVAIVASSSSVTAYCSRNGGAFSTATINIGAGRTLQSIGLVADTPTTNNGGVYVDHWRVWSDAKSSGGLDAERVAASAVDATNLLSDSPLPDTSTLNVFSLTGTLSNGSDSPYIVAGWNTSGTGPRVYPVAGNGPLGAGSFGTFIRGTDSGGGGSTITQAGATQGPSQASASVVIVARGESYSNGQAGGGRAALAVAAGASNVGSQAAGAWRATVIAVGASSAASQAGAGASIIATGAAQAPSQASGGTVIAVVGLGAAQAPSQASATVSVVANAAAHAQAQAAAFSQIIARGETAAGAQAPAGVAWAAAGASQAISQAAGIAQSNAVNATAGTSQGASQAAAFAVIVAAGVSYSSSQAASSAAYAIAKAGESSAPSAASGGVVATARGEGASNAAAAGALVSTAVVPGVSQAASQAAGVGSDGSVVVSARDAYVGFIVNMGKLMNR